MNAWHRFWAYVAMREHDRLKRRMVHTLPLHGDLWHVHGCWHRRAVNYRWLPLRHGGRA